MGIPSGREGCVEFELGWGGVGLTSFSQLGRPVDATINNRPCTPTIFVSVAMPSYSLKMPTVRIPTIVEGIVNGKYNWGMHPINCPRQRTSSKVTSSKSP
ncbi:unnamed protein product [Protopolystoma xenopodis]|uniref:Uncharacterized protein n=1 Tax=Protopolystoma xenopodis TaxID=117903 RepID=A0A3S5FEK6_9PLAT|nr:unnamed protein product [Protopolystoma xenopodis]